MITLGQVITGIIVILLYLLVRNVLTFIKYSFEGKVMNTIKYVSYLVKIVIIFLMLFNMYGHFVSLADFIQGLSINDLGTTNYYTGVIDILWLVGIYFAACILEMIIGFGIIFPMIKEKIKNHRF